MSGEIEECKNDKETCFECADRNHCELRLDDVKQLLDKNHW